MRLRLQPYAPQPATPVCLSLQPHVPQVEKGSLDFSAAVEAARASAAEVERARAALQKAAAAVRAGVPGGEFVANVNANVNAGGFGGGEVALTAQAQRCVGVGTIRAQRLGPPESNGFFGSDDLAMSEAEAAAEAEAVWYLVDGTFTEVTTAVAVAASAAATAAAAAAATERVPEAGGFGATRWVAYEELVERIDVQELRAALGAYRKKVEAADRRAAERGGRG